MPVNLQEIERAKAMLSEATAILAQASAPEEKKPRVVVKMARNVQHGEIVDLPDWRWLGEVVGWGMNGDQVTILLPGDRLASFDATQRVRVVRG